MDLDRFLWFLLVSVGFWWFLRFLEYTDMWGFWEMGPRDCHGFTNPHESQVWVSEGVGMDWQFTPPEKPSPVVWVSQGFTGSRSDSKKFFFFLRYSLAKLLFTNIILYYIKYCCNSSWNWSKTVKNEWKQVKMGGRGKKTHWEHEVRYQNGWQWLGTCANM